MKLKLDDSGHAVLQDGKPVYVTVEGKEIAFDAPGTVSTISRLNAEAKSHRERAEAAEGKLKAFEGIDDPAEARKALNHVKNWDAKKFVEAGEVEKLNAEISKVYEDRVKRAETRAQALEQTLNDELIGGSFARSKLIADKFAIPSDFVKARFGQHFRVEDGKVVALDGAGNKLYSPARPGELADFDEALGMIVESYPQKAQILKGTGATGGGATGGAGNGSMGTVAKNLGGTKEQRLAAIKSSFTELNSSP